MKTLDQIKEYKAQALDGRDISRLGPFLTIEQLPEFGLTIKEEAKATHVPLPFTRENVLKQLERDVSFSFEKALNQRGLSAGMMHDVVRMWNWILEEGLEDFDEYPMYGLPLFKATAVKYGFNNPIGDDTGSESKYDQY